MTEENKIIAQKIWQEIEKAQNILLHCHQNADGDSVASALATMHMLEGLGKKVTIIRGDTSIPRAYHHFPGFEKIVMKNYFEISISKFDLFIIQDSSTKDRVSRLQNIIFPESLRTVVIDHHDTNTLFGEINLIDAQAPATASILFELFKLWKINITKEIALSLLIGMYDDTGGFQYQSTTSSTFEMAAELSTVVPDYHETILMMHNMLDPKQMEFIALSLNSIEHYFSNKLALAAISHQSLQSHGIAKRDTTGVDISNRLRSVIGWDLDIAMTEYEEGEIGVSLRTRDENMYDLTKIVTPLGGGGHKAAAGIYLKMDLESAKKLLLDTIQKVYPHLGTP